MELSSSQQGKVESYLLEKLPHGSGIDCSWGFTWLQNGKLKATNRFHCMNEWGFYDGFSDFTLVFPVHKALTSFTLHFNGAHSQQKNRKYMLRDYLEDVIYSAMDGKESLFSIAIKEL